MARVTLGGGITSINGSIGGTTYQNGISGSVAKNKGIKTKSSSSQAQRSKLIASVISQSWSSLTEVARSNWNAYAIFKPVSQKNNSSRYLSGQMLYNLYNSAMYLYNGTTVGLPTFTTDPAISTTITIHSDGTNLFLRSSTTYDEGQYIGIYKLSAQIKPSQSRSVGGVKYIPALFAGGGEVNITAQYTAIYGTVPVVDEYVEMEYQIFNVGNPNWTPKVKSAFKILTY